MKGLKILALLGGFAVATSCCTVAFAADASKTSAKTTTKTAAKKPAKKAAAKPGWDETKAGGDTRGVALDALIASFKLKMDGGAGPAVEHENRSTTPVIPKQPAKVPHKAAAPVKKPVTVATTKTPATPNHIKNAIYTHSGDDTNAILAVSSAGPNGPIVTASLDKPGAVPKYHSGDRMSIKLHARQNCNVLVFDYDSKGVLTQLFPNEFEPDGKLNAGQDVEVGGKEAKYDLTIDGKGIERIFVYAYPSADGPITVAMNPVANTPFRSVEMTPDQYRRLVKESKIFFGGSDRGVKVTPKGGTQQVSNASAETEVQPNKLELTFQIDK